MPPRRGCYAHLAPIQRPTGRRTPVVSVEWLKGLLHALNYPLAAPHPHRIALSPEPPPCCCTSHPLVDLKLGSVQQVILKACTDMAYKAKPKEAGGSVKPWDGRSPISIAAAILYIITTMLVGGGRTSLTDDLLVSRGGMCC